MATTRLVSEKSAWSNLIRAIKSTIDADMATQHNDVVELTLKHCVAISAFIVLLSALIKLLQVVSGFFYFSNFTDGLSSGFTPCLLLVYHRQNSNTATRLLMYSQTSLGRTLIKRTFH